MADKTFYFYVIHTADDMLYAGYTDDVGRRFAKHQIGQGAKFLKPRSRRPFKVIHTEAFDNKHDAMSAEAKFKRLNRSEKNRYLAENG